MDVKESPDVQLLPIAFCAAQWNIEKTSINIKRSFFHRKNGFFSYSLDMLKFDILYATTIEYIHFFDAHTEREREGVAFLAFVSRLFQGRKLFFHRRTLKFQ